jgi:hypothetical protein
VRNWPSVVETIALDSDAISTTAGGHLGGVRGFYRQLDEVKTVQTAQLDGGVMHRPVESAI